jgi:hypothetical protein
MKINSYDTLLAEAKNWSGRSDLTDDQYNSFIYFTGSMANQLLRVAPMENTVILDVTEDGHVTIPADFLELKSLTAFFNSDDSVPLTRVAWEQYINYVNDDANATVTQPSYFAQQGAFWFLAPKPAVGTKVTCHYFRTMPDIQSTDQVNWLVQMSPLTYLYGVLHFLYLFIFDEERAAYWLEKLQGELTRLQLMYDSTTHSGSSLQVRAVTNSGDNPDGL